MSTNSPVRSFETLECRLELKVYFETVVGRTLESLSCLGHGLGPVDVPFETKGFRGLSVLIPWFAIAGLVTVSPRQKSPQPQQPDLTYHQTVIGWHGVIAGFGR